MQVIVVGDSLHVAHHVVATLSLQNELPIIVIDKTKILEKYMKKYNNLSALGLLGMAMALQGSSNPQEFETPKMAFDQASFRYKKKNNKGNSFVSNDYLKKRKRKNRLRRQAVRKQRKK
jgi:hypothetical protein